MANAIDPKNHVKSLAKGFRILQAFNEDTAELTLTELSTRTGLNAASVYRLVNTLVSLGYVRHEENTRRFRLSMQVLELGFNAIARSELREIVRPMLRSLAAQAGQTASIGILDEAEIVFIERASAERVHVDLGVRVGSRIPAYVAPLGRAILAYLSEEEVRAGHAKARELFQPRLVPGWRSLCDKLAETRECGYAISEGDIIPTTRFIAVPVFGPDQNPVAALNVSSLIYLRTLEEAVETTVPLLQETAHEVGKALEAIGPPRLMVLAS